MRRRGSASAVKGLIGLVLVQLCVDVGVTRADPGTAYLPQHYHDALAEALRATIKGQESE